MIPFAAIALREVQLAWRGGALWLPVVFYLSVATLFPFAVGPDRALLLRTGGGILWIAALLAALLPIDRLVEGDLRAGMIDQLVVRGAGEEMIAAAKIAGHWLAFAPPLLLATIVAAGLMGLPNEALARLLVALVIATPALAALAVTAAAMTAGLGSGAGALGGLLILPIATPLLIFGAGALGPDGASAIRLLGALSLVLTAGAPFASGAALRARRG